MAEDQRLWKRHEDQIHKVGNEISISSGASVDENTSRETEENAKELNEFLILSVSNLVGFLWYQL